jgi:hypothetical protein
MTLTLAEKRKYALALRRVDYGVWGFPVSLFKVITLTTRQSDDNSTGRFVKDFRKLIAYYRRYFNIEYCGVFEISPKSNLLHWHGLLRIKGGYFPVSRRMLGDKWNEIHHAFAVQIENVEHMNYLNKYINKHMVKNYISEEIIRNKFLVSRGWARAGIKVLSDDFRNWWRNASGDIWVSEAGYNTLNELIWRYCKKIPIVVRLENGYFIMDKTGKYIGELYED